MDNTMIDNIVSILKSGKSLPSSYQEVLFPVNNKEYTLQYKDKKSKEQIWLIVKSSWTDKRNP